MVVSTSVNSSFAVGTCQPVPWLLQYVKAALNVYVAEEAGCCQVSPVFTSLTTPVDLTKRLGGAPARPSAAWSINANPAKMRSLVPISIFMVGLLPPRNGQSSPYAPRVVRADGPVLADSGADAVEIIPAEVDEPTGIRAPIPRARPEPFRRSAWKVNGIDGGIASLEVKQRRQFNHRRQSPICVTGGALRRAVADGVFPHDVDDDAVCSHMSLVTLSVTVPSSLLV